MGIVASVLTLGGCAFLGNKDPLTIYSLRPTVAQMAVPKERPPRVNWQLIVETPMASDALDTPNILVMPSAGIVEMYRDARWNDAAPTLVRNLVVRAFEDSGRIIGVGNPATGLRGDYGLSAELRDFQAEYRRGVAFAVIRLHVKLLDYSANRVIASRVFQMEMPSTHGDVTSVVATFERALNQLLPAVVTWTLDQGELARTQRANARL